MKKTAFLLVTAGIVMLAAPIQAHQNSRYNRHDQHSSFSNRHDRFALKRINQRLRNQHHRIRDGIRSGELTHREGRRLRVQHKHIKILQREFLRDGYLNRHEKRVLMHKLDRASKRIHRFKHNDQWYYARQYQW